MTKYIIKKTTSGDKKYMVSKKPAKKIRIVPDRAKGMPRRSGQSKYA